MKDLPRVDKWPVSGAAETLEQLEELRAKLVRSQRDENAAIRKLNALKIKSAADRLEYNKLMAGAQQTRARAIKAYEAWNRAVESIGKRGEGKA